MAHYQEGSQLILTDPELINVIELVNKIVCNPKFICLMHSEAKQTETQEFGAEKSSLQGHARRMGGLCPHKTPNSWKCFSKAVLKAM